MVVYYFPPMGGSGVQRPLKFAKYLKKFGWEPIVVAPDPGLYHTFDETLAAELEKSGIRVERVKNRSLFGSGKGVKRHLPNRQFISSLLKWVTSWFFLPDNKKGWIDDAVRVCEQIIQKETVRAVFATAPPYSNLIVAQKVKALTGLPVVMDLRDDWLESHLLRYPTTWHFNKMRELELKTLSSADHITVVNSVYQKKIEKRLGSVSPGITTIPNGFDKTNFENTEYSGNNSRFTILYSGLFYESRKPDWLLKSIRLVMDRDPEFKKSIGLQFQGGLSNDHWRTINRLDLAGIVSDFGYVNHQQAVQNLVNADVLFLTVGERSYVDAVTPGKVFEYMGSRKPVLAYIPDGVTRQLLNRYGAARCVGIKDVEKGADQIESLFHLWATGDLPVGDAEFVRQFERKQTAKALTTVLQKMTV